MAERGSDGEAVVVAPAQRSPAAMLAKRTVQFGFLLLVLPRLIAYRVSRSLFGDRAFLYASESIARIPGMRGVYARQAFYRQTLAGCGRDVYIGWLSTFSMPQATLGESAYIGRRCSIGYAHIGPQAMLADGVQVLSGGNEHARTGAAPGQEPSAASPAAAADMTRDALQDGVQIYQRVSIGAGAWLGTNAVIMADVGAHAVVGAGAVVVHPVPAGETVGGVPARTLRRSASPEP